MIANASMDCDFHVVVHVTNDTAQAFHGQSATADSWIVKIELGPGASQDVSALFTHSTSKSGYLQGTMDDGTRINQAWSAARAPECSAPTTTAPAPVDTTPNPVTIGDHVVCIVPGSPTQEPVPCDSPRATTPDPPATTAPVVTTPVTAAPVAPEATPVVVGPPRSHAHVAQTVVHAQPATLPQTGTTTGPELAIAGLCLALGAALVRLTTRRHAPNPTT
jgi:LPXTG-motif cell wall-anchored protein